MQHLLIIFIFSIALFSNENSKALYSSCKYCHGFKGEKKYADTVPNINRLDLNILKMKLELYKKGLINEYGFGPIMQQQMKNIPDNKILQLSKYIKQLKEESK